MCTRGDRKPRTSWFGTMCWVHLWGDPHLWLSSCLKSSCKHKAIKLHGNKQGCNELDRKKKKKEKVTTSLSINVALQKDPVTN